MNYSYTPATDPTRTFTAILFWAAVLVLLAVTLSVATTTFEDGSFIIRLGSLDLGGCINPLALCAR